MSAKITNEQKNKVIEYLKPLVSEETLDNMKFALDNNMPILIKGSQKPTGKTTLCNILREYGVQAYEEFEIFTVELNKILVDGTEENKKVKSTLLFENQEVKVDGTEENKKVKSTLLFENQEVKKDGST